MNTRYRFFKWLKGFADKQMQENYLKPNGGCDSACPNCKEWESQGNKITTVVNDKDTDIRRCHKCNYEWTAIFTPCGFIPVDDCRRGSNV